MDFSKFSDDNFDVKEWVNAAFKTPKESTNDQHATTLVMKLQMFIQEVNNVIEESCQQAISNLPRVMRELDAVRQEALLLQDQMNMVKHDIQKVEQDTAQSMQMLLQLDIIKSRMKDASDALQEADNWTTLSADVDDVFESGDVKAIAGKLVGLQQSLQILSDVPDYAERCQFLETLKNRLEAMLSPQVVAAFSSASPDAAQMYVKIFSDIDRLPQLYKYYHKCQKGALLQCWRDIQEEQAGATLTEWLAELYDQLLTTWHTQIKWCSQVFQEPTPIVVDLLTESLSSLEPSLPASVATHLQSDRRGQPVDALIQLKQVTDRFAKNIEAAIDSTSPDNLQLSCVNKLAGVIYAPYRPYVEQFGELEEASLTKTLDTIPLDHREILDCVRLLSESVPKLFAAAREANERCVQLTSGCGYVKLQSALQSYFSDYVHEFRRVLTNLREKCQVDSPTVDTEDWSMFQNAMRVIQTCGDLILHRDELEQQLISSIVTTATKFCPPSSPSHDAARSELKKNPFHDYRTLLLSSEESRRELEALITGLQEGEVGSVLDEVRDAVCQLSEQVHKLAFDIVFSPVHQQLSHVPSLEAWSSQSTGGAITADLPDFSLSPQEYITKIGQYLMTLPQQLEPFTTEEDPTLTTALKYGKLPYSSQQAEKTEQLADVWLESLAKGSMHHYTENILKIPQLTSHANKQLCMDIDYMCNVLDDLGLTAMDSMTQTRKLLQASPDEFAEAAEDMPTRLTNTISQIRGLDETN